MITQNQQTQSALSADDALAMLREGNERFVSGNRQERDLGAQVQATSGGQYPFAAVLCCIDSRVSAELIFDQGIGDVFCARVAGNFVNEDILGSIEYAAKFAGSKLVLVLGHTGCGAVKGACDGVEGGNLTKTLSRIKPAIAAVSEPSNPDERNSGNADFVQAVAETNVDLTVAAVRERSEVLDSLEKDGTIRIVGAMYDVATGQVHFRD